jgi:hypothetical protein
VNGKPIGRGPYRNIRNAPGSIKWYVKKMKLQFPGATHINFYNYKGIHLFQERYETEQIEYKKHKRLIINYLDYAFSITGQTRKYNEMIFSQWDP